MAFIFELPPNPTFPTTIRSTCCSVENFTILSAIALLELLTSNKFVLIEIPDFGYRASISDNSFVYSFSVI